MRAVSEEAKAMVDAAFNPCRALSRISKKAYIITYTILGVPKL